MKRLVTVLVAGSIGLGSAFAQGPQCPAGQMPQRNTISDAQRIEMRVDRLQEKLGLTDAQAEEMTTLLTQQTQERKEAVAAPKKRTRKRTAKTEAAQEGKKE